MFDVLNWLQWFSSPWLNAFSWFSVTGLIVAAVLAYFLGLRPLLEGFFTFLVKFIEVLAKGCKDILDDWVTIVTVVFCAFFLYTAMEVKQEAAVNKIENKLEACKTEVQKLKKYIPKLPKDFGKPSNFFDFLFK